MPPFAWKRCGRTTDSPQEARAGVTPFPPAHDALGEQAALEGLLHISSLPELIDQARHPKLNIMTCPNRSLATISVSAAPLQCPQPDP